MDRAGRRAHPGATFGPQHRQEAQRRHDREMRHRVRRQIRRSHRRHRTTPSGARDRRTTSTLSTLPDPGGHAGSGSWKRQGHQDIGRRDLRRRGAHRDAPVRPIHRVHRRQRGRRVDGREQKAICDGFVYIRQHGPGTASLNVAVASALVMHHFALWAGYEERAREGEKCDVIGEGEFVLIKGVVAGRRPGRGEAAQGGGERGGGEGRGRGRTWTGTGRWASSFDRSHWSWRLSRNVQRRLEGQTFGLVKLAHSYSLHPVLAWPLCWRGSLPLRAFVHLLWDFTSPSAPILPPRARRSAPPTFIFQLRVCKNAAKVSM